MIHFDKYFSNGLNPLTSKVVDDRPELLPTHQTLVSISWLSRKSPSKNPGKESSRFPIHHPVGPYVDCWGGSTWLGAVKAVSFDIRLRECLDTLGFLGFVKIVRFFQISNGMSSSVSLNFNLRRCCFCLSTCSTHQIGKSKSFNEVFCSGLVFRWVGIYITFLTQKMH